MKRAFTLVELLVTITIVTLIAGAGVSTTVQTIQRKNLAQAASKMDEVIVRARDYALAGRKVSCTGTLVGWRVVIGGGAPFYTLQEECSNGGPYVHESGAISSDSRITISGSDSMLFLPLGKGLAIPHDVQIYSGILRKAVVVNNVGHVSTINLANGPTPTSGPVPTNTPIITPTNTVAPTNTPAATNTPTSTPSGGGFAPVYTSGVNHGIQTNLTSVASSAVTPVANGLYMATVSAKGSGSVTSVSGLGLTWTLVTTQCSAEGLGFMSVYKAYGSPAAAGQVTANFSGTMQSSQIGVARYTNVSAGVNSVGTIVKANNLGVNGGCSGGTNGTNYSTDINVLSGTLVNGGVWASNGASSLDLTVGSPFFERAERDAGATTTASVLIPISTNANATSNSTQTASGSIHAAGTTTPTGAGWIVILTEIR